MDAESELRRILETAVKGLCDTPSAATSEIISRGGASMHFLIRCDKADHGRIVGTGGRNISALRQIMTSVGAKHKLRVGVMLDE